MRHVIFAVMAIIFVCTMSTGIHSSSIAGIKKEKNTVLVCHLPPGNPDNWHTIEISQNALNAHLSHGDLIGPCEDHCQTLCDDGDACTIDDCHPGTDVCLEPREVVDCYDAFDCTHDDCDPTVGCVYVADDERCPDGICDPTDPEADLNGCVTVYDCPCPETLLQPPEAWVESQPSCYGSVYWHQLGTIQRFQLNGRGVAVVDCNEYFIGIGEGCSCFYMDLPGGTWAAVGLSRQEASVCAASVWDFAVNELGLECSGEFPGFERTP